MKLSPRPWIFTALALVLPSPLRAQTNCTLPVGPDVICGDVTSPVNYAIAGNIDAISFGALICNIGNAQVAYTFSTNQHPITGQSLYRLKTVNGANRFEEIGQSWVFHGFFALSGSLCCATCTPTDGSKLGIGCSSPDTASTMGSATALGPRWQINAFNGAFSVPVPHPPATSTVSGRLQVHSADLEVTGAPGAARFFGELHFIAPDDALAGNGANNASYREASAVVNGAEWNLGVLGAVHREQAAIRAWRDVDPTVTETNVPIPGEGFFILAHQVTNLGAGTWHYEYALYNQSSDLSGQSFSIPIPAGVNVSNIGFHDVDYHDGDGPGSVDFDGTDWPSSIASGSLTFATTPFAVNASANALRWGTTYNFRFDADSPPQSGSVTIGLFKPGGPASVSATADVPSANTFVPFCFGDGSGTACPCGNNSASGSQAGCLNSLALAGKLVASGGASLSADTVVLSGSGMPNASALYFQGDQQENGGLGVQLGDGLRCAGGALVRLGTELNVANSSQYPGAGQLPVSVKGMVSSPGTRTYQVWYRNAASFCAIETFNLSNGVQVTWAP